MMDPNPERYQKIIRMLARRQPDLLVLMDKVHKPQNLAAVIRTCDAVGIGTVHAIYPGDRIKQCRHIARGASRWVDVCTHSDIAKPLLALKQQGFQVIAAHPHTDAVSYRKIDFTQPTCVIAGAELDGLSAKGIELADHLVSIPMCGMAQSLNVSVATAIILFEAQAQREASGMYERSRLSLQDSEHKIMHWLYPKIAAFCDRNGLRYPQLNEHGELDDPEWQALRKAHEQT